MRLLALLPLFCAAPLHAACEATPHRQFDFWLGRWEVRGAPGSAAADTVYGSNEITRVSEGCGLAEHWRNARGLEGRSLNVYDAIHAVWRQFWVGADGVVLRLEGGLVDDAMVLRGALPKTGGGEQLQRITWTPARDGSVMQQWDVSDDGGKSWTTSFLGHYTRSAATP